MEGVDKTMSAQTVEQVKKRVANVVLLGCGGVGAHLLQRILATRALHASTGLHVAVVAVSDSKGMVLSKEELDDSVLKDIISAKAKKVSLSQWCSSGNEALFQYRPIAGNESTLQVLQTWNKTTVVVDCTASEETGELLGQAAVQGFCVVLANKKPITATLVRMSPNPGKLNLMWMSHGLLSEEICMFLHSRAIPNGSVASFTEKIGESDLQSFPLVPTHDKTSVCSIALQDVYDRITSAGRCFRCESTVGAGLPVMAALSRTLAAGDPIHRIVGALSGEFITPELVGISVAQLPFVTVTFIPYTAKPWLGGLQLQGTLGYVMSGLQDGRLYSEVVASAKALGYTEPDPRDDLSGMDVARKALIMARAIGWRLNMEDVEVMSLYPPEMGPLKMSVEEFLARLPSIDTWMRGKVQAAQERRSVLRYVATIENNKCKVSFTEVSPDSPLGRLRGSDNLVEIHTDCYKMAPLVIQGAGAGNDTTAAGVLADIIDLQDLYKP